MHDMRKLIFPLGGLVLMVTVALILTRMTAPPDDMVGIPDWASDHIGREQTSGDVRQIDWDSMPGEVIAWVEVPGTDIDEPIVQAAADCPDRYLHDDVFGEGGYGTPYIDCDCSLEGPLTIVYGHHMSDGSVFADFADFSDAGYAGEHRTIYLYTRADGQRHELQCIAVNVIDASCESLQTRFKDEKAFDGYVAACLGESEVTLEKPDSISHLFAFATCSYETRNSRTVVYAVEI